MNSIDRAELEIHCLCGDSENFERVIVQRKPHPPIVTDFVACVACRAMYFAPVPQRDPPERLAGRDLGAIGGPAPDGYKGPLFSPRTELGPAEKQSPEDRERFMDAVRRADKSKHKGRRG